MPWIVLNWIESVANMQKNTQKSEVFCSILYEIANFTPKCFLSAQRAAYPHAAAESSRGLW